MCHKIWLEYFYNLVILAITEEDHILGLHDIVLLYHMHNVRRKKNPIHVSFVKKPYFNFPIFILIILTHWKQYRYVMLYIGNYTNSFCGKGSFGIGCIHKNCLTIRNFKIRLSRSQCNISKKNQTKLWFGKSLLWKTTYYYYCHIEMVWCIQYLLYMNHLWTFRSF